MKNYLMSLNKLFMKLTKYLTGIALLAMIFPACKKIDYDTELKGEALGDFRLSAPSNNMDLVLNGGTPANTITISWTASKPGVSIQPTYKWIAASKAGNLDAPLIEIPSGSSGTATSLTLTQKQIDDALAAKGIAAGAKAELIWSISATNGTTTIRSQDIFNISITRMKDGATPFILLGPAPTSAALEINPTSTTDSIKFNWTRSKPAAGGPGVTYRVLFSNSNSFTSPLFSMSAFNNGVDSILHVSYGQISDSLAVHGYADLGLQADLKWTVVATSGAWKQQADYTNTLSILRQVKFYVVGALQSPAWDIDHPLEMITDKKSDRYGKVFYTYVKLNSGDGFKFFKTKGDWGSGFGNNGVSGAGFTTGYNVGGDFSVSAAGIYRLTLDVEHNMAYVQQKQVGVVGGMQGWNPSAPTYGGYVERDKFIIITPSAGEEFKFHDGSAGAQWTFGVKDDRWWGNAGDNKLNYDGGDPNIVSNATRTRLIWDGTNSQQVKYEKIEATEMRVVGNGMDVVGVNDWDPPTSPQMTYSGNGVWTVTLKLKANLFFKFVAGNAWGAFDYEDNSGQSQTLGTARPIKWTGGSDFKTPATAGTYTITLNEHTQTVTVN